MFQTKHKIFQICLKITPCRIDDHSDDRIGGVSVGQHEFNDTSYVSRRIGQESYPILTYPSLEAYPGFRVSPIHNSESFPSPSL